MAALRHWIARTTLLALIGVLLPMALAPSASATPREDLLTLLNRARASAGVGALAPSSDMTSVAQSWSESMARRGQLAHNPAYSTQITGWRSLAENVAYHGSVQRAHDALMASPGHRRNILNPVFSQVGLGVTESGGTVWVTEVFREPTGQAPTPPVVRAGAALKDFNGDGRADVLGVDTGSRLLLYPGTAARTIGAPRQLGSGWGGMSLVTQVGDITGDGAPDLLARANRSGTLWMYKGNGRGGFSGSQQFGGGWGAMNLLLGVGDWTGDRVNDVLARHTSTGTLLLYAGNGRGGLLAGRAIGRGWGSVDLVTAVTDIDGDARADLLARQRSTSRLVLYPSNGKGGFKASRVVGFGWSAMNTLYGPGQWDGAAGADLIARRSDGALFLYGGDGRGSFGKARQIGRGWSSMRLVP